MELKEIENSDVWIIIIYLFLLCFTLTFNNFYKKQNQSIMRQNRISQI